MYLLNNNDVKEIEETTFASIDIREKDLEEILRKNINMICDPDDESMLIIGQQVANEKRARSDLTAIDSYTFKSCSGLTSISIPGSVTEIGQSGMLQAVQL